MKIFRKILLIGVGLVVLLFVGILAAGIIFINPAARKGIELGANKALGVPTTLKSVNVGIFSGKFGMSGLNVGNAPSFPSDHFLNLGEARVAVSISSLNKDVIELPEFFMDNLDVRLERREGKSNYQVILDNIAKLSGPAKPGDKPKPAPSTGKEKKFIVKQVTLRNITVHADMVDPTIPALSQLAAVTVPIPEIKLQNVGQTGTGVGGSGVTVAELSSIIVQAIMAAVAEKGGVLPEQFLADLKSQLGSLGGLKGIAASFITDLNAPGKPLGEQFGASVQGLGDKTKSDLNKELDKLGPGGAAAKDAAGKAIDQVTDKLKGLLPKPKEEPKPATPPPAPTGNPK